MTYKLPEPDLYAHELLDNGGGVWLGVDEKGICEQAHVEGETGEEIRIYYTEAKVQAAYAAGLAALELKAAADALEAAQPQFPVNWAMMLHYPECWDTAAYPELRDAIHEALAWSGCSVCKPAQPAPQVPMTDAQLNDAAKVLAEAFDYPWEHMPEQGRNTLRGHVKDVLKAIGVKP